MNNIYVTLIEAQLVAFVRDYTDTAQDVFYDELQEGLIHPGEFGAFRESLIRELLSNFLPEAFGVSQGFVISPEGSVSNQCDIVIYSRTHAPILKTPEHQRFFPIEAVVAVGEVKSVVRSGAELQKALIKLAKLKQMRSDLKGASVASSVFRDVGPYSPSTHHLDQIATFLIASNFDCSDEAIESAIDGAVGSMHPSHRVNMLVGVGDGKCVSYRDSKGIIWPFPVDVDPISKKIIPGSLPIHFLRASLDAVEHTKLFLRFLQLLVSRTSILHANIGGYWGDPK